MRGQSELKRIAIWLVFWFCIGAGTAHADDPLDVTFFVTSDVHVCSVERDGVTPTVARNHVKAINTATSESEYGKKVWPTGSAGLPSAGQRIKEASGVLLAGDWAIDQAPVQHKECWDLFVDLYSAGRKPDSIRFPAFPGFGNHDWVPPTWNYTFNGNANNVAKAHFIRDVTKDRGVSLHWPGHRCPPPPLTQGNSQPVPYSWNWGKLHLVNLNTWIGEPGRCITWLGLDRGYGYDFSAWQWLEQDLARHAANFGPDAPIVIFQHYGYDEFSTSRAGDGWNGWWWSPDDRTRFESILNRYNVIALFSGHNHAVGNRQFGSVRQFLNVSTGSGLNIGGFWAVHVTDTLIEMAYLSKKNPDNGNGETTVSGDDPFALWRPLSPAGVLPLRTGDRIALRADNWKLLSRINRGQADPIEAAKDAPDSFTSFKVTDLGNGRIALQADNGKFLSRINRGQIDPIEAAKDTQDDFTSFKMTDLGSGQIALQADTGKYWSRINPGTSNPIEAAKTTRDPFCAFTVVLLGRQ
jgi:cytolysin (calcineurin-like family phosphatase)